MPATLVRPTLTPAILTILGALSLFAPLGTDAFLPALPVMAQDLHSNASGVQLALSGFTIGMAAGQLLAGPISDAVGRRRPILVGAVGVAIVALTAALATNATALVVSCAAIGLFAAVGIVVSRAMVADLAHGPALTRAYSMLGMLTAVGPVLGPLFGVALMLLFGWRGIFVGIAAAALACFTFSLVVLPESHPPEQRAHGGLRTLGRNLATVLRSRTFLGSASIIWLAFSSLFAYISASSFVVQTVLGFSAVGYTLVFAINGVGMIATGLLTVRFSARLPGRTIVAFGLGMQAVGAVIIIVSSVAGVVSSWVLLPGMMLIASSMGFIFGPCSAAALHGLRHASGTALALIGSFQFLFAGLAAPLVGVAGEDAVLPFGIVVATCAGLAWTAWVTLRPRAG